MRKDVLAAGAKSAQFAVGLGKTGDAVELRNHVVMSDEDREALEADDREMTKVEHEEKPKKIFRPRGTTILVRRQSVEELSSILVTDTLNKEQPCEGTVLAVGKGTKDKPVDVSEGDHIVFGKYSGTEFKVNGETLLIMDIDDVKGTLADEVLEEPYSVGGCVVGRA